MDDLKSTRNDRTKCSTLNCRFNSVQNKTTRLHIKLWSVKKKKKCFLLNISCKVQKSSCPLTVASTILCFCALHIPHAFCSSSHKAGAAELRLTYMHLKIVFLPSAFLPMQDKCRRLECVYVCVCVFSAGPAQQLWV